MARHDACEYSCALTKGREEETVKAASITTRIDSFLISHLHRVNNSVIFQKGQFGDDDSLPIMVSRILGRYGSSETNAGRSHMVGETLGERCRQARQGDGRLSRDRHGK